MSTNDEYNKKLVTNYFINQLFDHIRDDPEGEHSQEIKNISDCFNEMSIDKIDISSMLSSFHCKFGDSAFKPSFIRAVCKILKQTKSVQTLILTDCDLSAAISAINLEGTQINHLQLGQNNLTTQSILHLKSILKSCPITHLNLSYNELDDAGFLALGKAIEESEVSVLDIQYMGLNYERAISMVPFIFNSSLEKINCNEMGINLRVHECFIQTMQGKYGKGLNQLTPIFPDPLLDIMASYLVEDECMLNVQREYMPSLESQKKGWVKGKSNFQRLKL